MVQASQPALSSYAGLVSVACESRFSRASIRGTFAPDEELFALGDVLRRRKKGIVQPLHCDSEFAARAGFDRPIIHGLCSYGIVCKAIVDGPLEGNPERVASDSARFRGVAFPGETHRISYWNDGDRLLVEARSKQRDAPILSNAVVTLR